VPSNSPSSRLLIPFVHVGFFICWIIFFIYLSYACSCSPRIFFPFYHVAYDAIQTTFFLAFMGLFSFAVLSVGRPASFFRCITHLGGHLTRSKPSILPPGFYDFSRCAPFFAVSFVMKICLYPFSVVLSSWPNSLMKSPH